MALIGLDKRAPLGSLTADKCTSLRTDIVYLTVVTLWQLQKSVNKMQFEVFTLTAETEIRI